MTRPFVSPERHATADATPLVAGLQAARDKRSQPSGSSASRDATAWIVANLRVVADDADATAAQREVWADANDRQAAVWRAEAGYLRAYASEARRLAEEAR